MAKTYHLQILTPEQILFDEEVYSLIAPGGDGYFGVLADHAALITTLIPGKFMITDKDHKSHYYHISYGFFEVSKNHASVLLESIEKAEPFDMGAGI